MISLIEHIPIGNRAERAYHLYRCIPRSILHKLEMDNFRKTIRYVGKHSEFYQRKFSECRIDPSKVRVPEDLGDFFTTSEDIRENPEAFLCAKPDTAYETTGTTSRKSKKVYFSRFELHEAGWAGAVGLWAAGVRPEDRVVSAFDYSFWISGPLLHASCGIIGCFHVEAGRMEVEEFYERLCDYRVTVIVGDPSWILRLSQVAQKKGRWPVKLLIGGGENMSEEARTYVENVWGADLFLNYGQTEALGTIGIESSEKSGYHLNEFHTRCEIINPDAEGYGELVYTTLNRRTMPLVRYRTGDITRFVPSRPQSFLPGLRIEKIKGRTNEWTATGMGNLAPWMFEPVFGAVKGIGPDWQIVLDKDHNVDRATLVAERLDPMCSDAEIASALLKETERCLGEVWRYAKMGFGKLDVRISSAGSLRSGRKLQRLVDKRIF